MQRQFRATRHRETLYGQDHDRCREPYPHVLGALREDLDAGTRAVVAGEVVKNLVKHTVAEIRQHLPERL